MTPAERIKEYISNKGIKQSFLSAKAGINYSNLNSKLNGRTKLTLDEFILICYSLECTPNEFIKPIPARR